MEDENSQDFVKILSPVVKKRPLTDHQKDKLTSRRDDIPALYSEHSIDDSQTVSIPAQFQSQNESDMSICSTKENLSSRIQGFSMNNQANEIKPEKDVPEGGDNFTSIECSMSIIDPKSIVENKITATKETTEGMDRFLKQF